MDKSEEIILKENMNEKELSETKNYKRIKYSIAIIASTLIFAAIITLSIGYFKIEIVKEETKPMVRNLGFDVVSSKTYNLGSFKINDQTVSIKYVISMTETQCQNKIIITSRSGSFEFGNTGISSPGQGSKTYTTQIIKFKLSQFPLDIITGFAKGSLSWDVKLISTNKYSVGLSGTLNFYSEKKSHVIVKKSCIGKGILSEAKGNLIVSEGSITKDSDFSFRMGNLEINCITSGIISDHTTMKLFEGWRYIE